MGEAFGQIILVIVAGMGIVAVALLVSRLLAKRIEKIRSRQDKPDQAQSGTDSDKQDEEIENTKTD